MDHQKKGKILMSLDEALRIKKAIETKVGIERSTKNFTTKLNDTEINLLAGLTENFCIIMKRSYITAYDLEKIRKMHETDWRKNRRGPNDYDHSSYDNMKRIVRIQGSLGAFI